MQINAYGVSARPTDCGPTANSYRLKNYSIAYFPRVRDATCINLILDEKFTFEIIRDSAFAQLVVYGVRARGGCVLFVELNPLRKE